MKLDLRERTMPEEIQEHWERFISTFEYELYAERRDMRASEHGLEEEISWFTENAPWLLPNLDRYVLRSI